MFGRGKVGKRKLVEVKKKKSREKVQCIDPVIPMRAPPPPTVVEKSSWECSYCGFQ